MAEFDCGCRLDEGRYPVGCDSHTREIVQYVGVTPSGRAHTVTVRVLTADSPVKVARSGLGR